MWNLRNVVILLEVILLGFGQEQSETGLKMVRQFNAVGKKLRTSLPFQDDNLLRLVVGKLDSIEKLIDSYHDNYLVNVMPKIEQDDIEVTKGDLSKHITVSLKDGTVEEKVHHRSKRQIDFAALGFDLETTCDNETMPVFLKLLQVEQGIKNNSKDIEKIVSLDLKDLADGNKLNKDNIEEINENVKHIMQSIELLLNLGLYRIETCADLKTFGNSKSGVYRLAGKDVYCDQDTDGGGWMVFQRRVDGSMDFYRTWEEYKEGFGDLNGEFWLGNEYLSKLTDLALRGWQELRVDMITFTGEKYYAKYSSFRIMSETDNYRMFAFDYRGNAGNGLYKDIGKHFCTKDRDNDRSAATNCAMQYKGGWWYSDCYSANLNGVFYDEGADRTARDGIEWTRSSKDVLILTYVEMKFRKNNYYL